MLSPQDIRTKTFTKAIRGYSPEEVDKYLELLGEKYDEIFRENRELEYKVQTLTEELAETSGPKQISQTLDLAQKAADKLVHEAEKKAELIYSSAQKNTDKVLAQFRDAIAAEALVYEDLKICVKELKESIYRTYRENLEKVESIAPTAEHEDSLKKPETAKYIEQVIAAMKSDMAEYEQMSMNVDDISSPSLTIDRAPSATSKRLRVASVKDTVKEINKKIISGDGTQNEQSETKDDANEQED